MGIYWWLSPFTLMLICIVIVRCEDEQHDAREGDDVTLQCRFALEHIDTLSFYWVRSTASGHDNVAIGDTPLETDYQIDSAPLEGRFDLMISNVTYERDNGRFECRIKAKGSGRSQHSQGHTLVVLTQPQQPVLNTGPQAQAQEGRQLNITCSSIGGSPSPTIKWYRDGLIRPLEAELVVGKTRGEPTVSILTVDPSRDDDGTTFRCVVRNRAMREGQQLEATVDLSVNYFPRVKVGPENPLRVEINGTANMVCEVDAKPKVSTVKWIRDNKAISSSINYKIQRVTIQDAGKYICKAENGVGQPGENNLYLDVLYPPRVTIDSKTYEAEEGGNVEIRCVVSSNPEPTFIEWTKDGKENFRQKGNTLLLTQVDADMAGTYMCRAVNVISLSSGNKVEKAGIASVTVLVRHKPGPTSITPDHPIAQEGKGMTLTCSANPPGWPLPQYRWLGEIQIGEIYPKVLATGNKFTISSVHLGSEGIYRCQAINELGHSVIASVNLEVYQPPRFQSKLQSNMIKKSGDRNFSLVCVALGKPLPNIKWYKDNAEIRPDANLYEVQTEINKSSNAVYNIHSILKFHGRARPNGDDLLPADRGSFTCSFENEVKKVESTVQLRIEHEPISVKQEQKVAYDLNEDAQISCRVLAYPNPEFQWFFHSNSTPLQMSSDDHYQIGTTTNKSDIYLSVLIIRNVKPQDYGDYYCKVQNPLGSLRPQIRLQPKGAPESPKSLSSLKVDSTFVSLKWEEGFNGGLTSKYFVLYRLVKLDSEQVCFQQRPEEFDWKEYDCGRSNPCNVTRLEQYNSYYFKIKAVNTKGQSNYSNEILVTTKVNKILPPEQFSYDPSTKAIVFSVGATCLPLVAVIEGLLEPDEWKVFETMPLHLSGTGSTIQETTLLPPLRGHGRARSGSSYDRLNSPLRLKLCLQNHLDICSNYIDADTGRPYPKDVVTMTTGTIVVMIVSCLIFLMCPILLFIFCRRKRIENQKDSTKIEMTSPPPQAPPPYYAATGRENKALESSMDIPLSMADSKSVMYATQPYGYHHPGQNITSTDWVNIGYMENSYANSNNGGSVNSQDSLWQMKMAAANNPPVMSPHQMIDRQSNYGYDPIAHGGYGTNEDYEPYSHLPLAKHATHAPHAAHATLAPHASHATHGPPSDYGLRSSQNPSRQDYCSDPYASVHKPKKRMDQHMESPYHEVSGLPDAYAEAGGEDKPALSLSYDESLESGYSTPNSRARRVIREIIV